MKISVIGTNFISDALVEAVRLEGRAEIHSVFSRKLDTGSCFAEKHGIKRVFTDLDEMLSSEDLDAVYVASPTVCHESHAIASLKAEKHVLCEKALSTDYSSARRMLDVARASGKVLLEAMRPVHDPFYNTVRSALPRIGKIRRAHLEYCQYSSRYDRFKSGILTNAFDVNMKNSALSDIGIYPFTVAVFLFGEPSSLCQASVRLDNGFDGSGSLLLAYPEMTATVAYSKITDSTTPSVIEGELGSIHIDKLSAPSSFTLILRDGTRETITAPPVPNNMIYEVSDFIDIVERRLDGTPYFNLTESVMRLLDKRLSPYD